MPLKSRWLALTAISFIVVGMACNTSTVEPTKRIPKGSTDSNQTKLEPEATPAGMAKASFASGCFWCTEAIFQQLKGVKSVVSGYSGGSAKKPSYDEVCSGSTGHAEAVQVTYDPQVIKYQDLLEVFWKSHDPTTPDRQGHDVGPQYRSVIFHHDDEQKQLAEHYKKKLDDSGIFGGPIVTQIVPFTELYRAEDFHQNYYNQNPQRGYCQFVIEPKLEKIKQLFHDKLK